jgi:eukaryotic-like serine/threonine-protein kinase
VAGAGSLLEGFVAQAGPDADPFALADARQKLANIELLRGQTDRAAALLDQARDFWSRAPQRYAEERLEGLGIRARLQRARGDLDGAIATSRQAIEARTALSGRDQRETAVLYNSLAITLTSANRLEDALEAYRETLRIYRAIGLGDTLDAQVFLGNMGTLELRIGHLRESETLLKTAVKRERELAGDSAAVAAAMGYYGKVLSVENRIPEAIGVLREGVRLAGRYAGEKSPVTVQNQIFLGEAQSAAADKAGARTTLESAQDAALAQYGPSHPLTLRTQLALARLSAASGNSKEARSRLPPVIAGLRALGTPAVSYLAQALETLGEVSLADGDTQAAVDSLSEAVRLQQQSRDQTWESAVTRERLGEASLSSRRTEAVGLLRAAEHDLEAELGANHPQTLRAEHALAKVTP